MGTTTLDERTLHAQLERAIPALRLAPIEPDAPRVAVNLDIALNAPLPKSVSELLISTQTFEIAPRTVEEADALLGLLKADVANIDRQLADELRRDNYPDVLAYAHWRRRAIRAKQLKQAEIGKLTFWRKARLARNTAKQAGLANPDDPLELIRAMVVLLKSLADDDGDINFEFEPEEQRLIDAASAFLQRA